MHDALALSSARAASVVLRSWSAFVRSSSSSDPINSTTCFDTGFLPAALAVTFRRLAAGDVADGLRPLGGFFRDDLESVDLDRLLCRDLRRASSASVSVSFPDSADSDDDDDDDAVDDVDEERERERRLRWVYDEYDTLMIHE